MSNSRTVVQTKSLRVGYNKKSVVEVVDIEALRGEIVCLLGPNGAGKSTILRTLSSMLSPVEGTVYLDGENITSVPKGKLAKFMSVVLTDRLNPGLMTAFEIAAMGRHPYTGFFGKLKNEDKEIVLESLASVKALNLADRYFNELSDGEKQKVKIARALAQEPELIVLDEPTSHLDISHRIEVVEILSKLCRDKGITVIMALHDIDLALKGCQTVLLIKNGKIVAHGAPEKVIHQGVIQDLYDISEARYDDLLGSMEFGGSRTSDMFIVSGAGSGIPVFRTLRKTGLGMDCGILHQSDIDTHVAMSLCNKLVVESDFQRISDAKFKEATEIMANHSIVVDTGFPIGETNEKNTQLLLMALDAGKDVYTFRNKESQNLYQCLDKQPIYCSDASELAEMIRDGTGQKEPRIPTLVTAAS